MGPATSTIKPEEYYFIPDGTLLYLELADEQCCLLIHDQMAVFRTKPFIAGAIFWTYQDYRTRSLNFVMGVVDPERNKHPSWEVLREEYSLCLIRLAGDLPGLVDGQCTATVTFHTRGPVVCRYASQYFARVYSALVATSPDGSTKFSEGDISSALRFLQHHNGWEIFY